MIDWTKLSDKEPGLKQGCMVRSVWYEESTSFYARLRRLTRSGELEKEEPRSRSVWCLINGALVGADPNDRWIALPLEERDA